MKIAIIAPEFIPPWGGVGVYSYELAKALLRKQGLEVHVITPRRSSYSGEGLKGINLHYLSQANDTFFYNLKFQMAVWKDFKKLHRIHGFDIVHSTSLVQMPDVFLKMKAWDIPFVTTVHTTIAGQSRIRGLRQHNSLTLAPVEILSRLAYPYIRGMERFYIRKSANFICVSDWIREHSKVFNSRVIHNGVDEDRFYPVKRDNDVPVVLYVGRLLAMKGIDSMLKALLPLLRNKSIKLLIAGPGNKEKYYGLLKGVDKRQCIFLGNVPYQAIHKLYLSSDIFLLPSLTESFPLSVLEAMSSGCAVIATDVGGIPEMIDNGLNGILIPPADVKAISSATSLLADDGSLRSVLGHRARKKVEGNFTVKRMCDGTYGFYKEIIAEA